MLLQMLQLMLVYNDKRVILHEGFYAIFVEIWGRNNGKCTYVYKCVYISTKHILNKHHI